MLGISGRISAPLYQDCYGCYAGSKRPNDTPSVVVAWSVKVHVVMDGVHRYARKSDRTNCVDGNRCPRGMRGHAKCTGRTEDAAKAGKRSPKLKVSEEELTKEKARGSNKAEKDRYDSK